MLLLGLGRFSADRGGSVRLFGGFFWLIGLIFCLTTLMPRITLQATRLYTPIVPERSLHCQSTAKGVKDCSNNAQPRVGSGTNAQRWGLILRGGCEVVADCQPGHLGAGEVGLVVVKTATAPARIAVVFEPDGQCGRRRW